MSIELSLRSQEFINKYWSAFNPGAEDFSAPAVFDFNELLDWLNNKLVTTPIKQAKFQKEFEFILISLRTELVHDLYLSLVDSQHTIPRVKLESTPHNKLKFIMLSLAGILVAACEGFDSMVNMLSIFSLPATVILVSGFIFSFLSIFAFCGLDLVKLAGSLGVKLKDAHKLLDVYLRQFDDIKRIRKILANQDFSDLSAFRLQQLALICAMLQNCFVQLNEASDHFDKIFNSKRTQFANLVVSSVTAALFFGGSFCSGQTVAFCVLSFFMTTVTPVSLPVLLFSLVVGLAGLSLYWGVEISGLQTLISGWFGLDEEKIAVLCNKELVSKEQVKLLRVEKLIIDTCTLKNQVTGVAEPIRASETNLQLFKKSAPSSETILVEQVILSACTSIM